MAYSTQRVVSDGGTLTVALSIRYMDKSEISVYVSNVLYTGWSWGVGNTLVITGVPAGVEVLIKRTTDSSSPRHTYTAGAAFTARTLDESLAQVLHIAQESVEGERTGEFYTDVNMHGHRVRGAGAAELYSDLMTYGQYLQDVDGTHADRLAAQQSAAAAAMSAVASAESAAAAAASAQLAEVHSHDTVRLTEFLTVQEIDDALLGVVTDLTAKVQAAITAAAGRCLLVPSGFTVYVSALVAPVTGLRVIMHGATIRRLPGTSGILLQASGGPVWFVGGTFDGGNQTGPWVGVYVVGAACVRASGTTFKGFWRYPLRVLNTSDVHVHGCTFSEGSGAIGESSAQLYITTDAAEIRTIRVLNNTFVREGAAVWPMLQVRPDYVPSTGVYPVRDVICSGNVLRSTLDSAHVNGGQMEINGASGVVYSGNSHYGTGAIPASFPLCENLTVLGNSIRCGDAASASRDGFDHKAIEITDCRQAVVCANVIDGLGILRTGIRANANNTDVTLLGNSIRNLGEDFRGVEIGNTSGAYMSSNTVRGDGRVGRAAYITASTDVCGDVRAVGVRGRARASGADPADGFIVIDSSTGVHMHVYGRDYVAQAPTTANHNHAVTVSTSANVQLELTLRDVLCSGMAAVMCDSYGSGLSDLRLSGTVHGVFSTAARINGVDGGYSTLRALGTYSYGASLGSSNTYTLRNFNLSGSDFSAASSLQVLASGDPATFGTGVRVEMRGTAAPAFGVALQGWFVRNTAPTEAGTAGSKYVVFGWMCVSAGTPGTWVPLRVLTGN